MYFIYMVYFSSRNFPLSVLHHYLKFYISFVVITRWRLLTVSYLEHCRAFGFWTAQGAVMRKREEIRGRSYSFIANESLFTDMDSTKEFMVQFLRTRVTW